MKPVVRLRESESRSESESELPTQVESDDNMLKRLKSGLAAKAKEKAKSTEKIHQLQVNRISFKLIGFYCYLVHKFG